MVTPSTKPSKRAEAPFIASVRRSSYELMIAAAVLAELAAALAELAAVFALAVAVSAFSAALFASSAILAASTAAADACAAASVAGCESSDNGAETSFVPCMAGRELMPSSVVAVSSSSTLWLSVFISFRTS